MVDYDIDIDMADRDELLKNIYHIPASMYQDTIKKHPVGVYFQDIPTEPFEHISSIDYRVAEELGYVKIDFLNLRLYSNIRDNKHLLELMDIEPLWEMLEYKDIVSELFHIKNHFDIVSKMKPKNIDQLAMVLAMIRPAKKHLLGKSWDIIEKEIWKKPTNDEYFFKKSHAISYALVIKVQMNLLSEGL